MRSELQAKVDDLYRVFSRYPLVENVEYCDHCVDPLQVEALHRMPLRHVTAGQLGPLLPSVCDPREVLDTIADCGQEVSPYLDAWPVHVGEPAARQLAVLVSDFLVSSQQDSGFWREVNAWLSGPIPADVLAAEAFATGDADVARQLGDTCEHLALWRQPLTANTTGRTAPSPA